MIKAISKWLEAKDQAAKQEQYDNGYGYAATRILNYKETPHDAEFDVTIFDRGIRDASIAIGILQYKERKYEKLAQENKDLREIVRKMQTELRQLLEQIPTQALSVPAEEPKLPFRIEDLPDWAYWVAQDESGMWYAYESKPEEPDDMFDVVTGRYEFVIRGESTSNWRNTLQQVRYAESKPAVKLPFDVDALRRWANWVAQDGAGRWFAYEKKPWVGDYEWIEDSKDGTVDDVFQGEPNPNWKETLQRLTR